MTPPLPPGEPANYLDPFEDVFGSAPPSPTVPASAIVDHGRAEQRMQASDPSDIPRLRSIHVTNGYREGIAASKEKYIQEGFDEGYALGAEVGILAGWCLGALEGIWHGLPQDEQKGRAKAISGSSVRQVTRDQVQSLRSQAALELSVQLLLGGEYFGSDGIWLYDVPSNEGNEDVMFREVAKAHPVIKRWIVVITGLANAAGLNVENRSEGAD